MPFKSKRCNDKGQWLCLKCKRYRDRSSFSMSLLKKNGVSSICKECEEEGGWRLGIKRDRRNPQNLNEFWCPKCRKYYPREDFNFYSRSIYKLEGICRKCRGVYNSKKVGLKPKKIKVVTPKPISWIRAESQDRGSRAGFVRYFSSNTIHFKLLFGKEYSRERAQEEYDLIMEQSSEV